MATEPAGQRCGPAAPAHQPEATGPRHAWPLAVRQASARLPAALHAIDEQSAYAALDLTSRRPALYAASASVARALERITATDPAVRVVDTHPLGTQDPNGFQVFYLMIIATIISYLTVFQLRANLGRLPLRQWTAIIVGLAVKS
jgi:hypothetical protein